MLKGKSEKVLGNLGSICVVHTIMLKLREASLNMKNLNKELKERRDGCHGSLGKNSRWKHSKWVGGTALRLVREEMKAESMGANRANHGGPYWLI